LEKQLPQEPAGERCRNRIHRDLGELMFSVAGDFAATWKPKRKPQSNARCRTSPALRLSLWLPLLAAQLSNTYQKFLKAPKCEKWPHTTAAYFWVSRWKFPN